MMEVPVELPRGNQVKAITYQRVSTGKQAESGLSVDDQANRLDQGETLTATVFDLDADLEEVGV
jgi:hypothetical protein